MAYILLLIIGFVFIFASLLVFYTMFGGRFAHTKDVKERPYMSVKTEKMLWLTRRPPF